MSQKQSQKQTQKTSADSGWLRRLIGVLVTVVTIAIVTLVVTWPSAGAWAEDGRVAGHMRPLPAELLAQPLKLDCGLTVMEWRGAVPNTDRAARLCRLATRNFLPFIASKGLEREHGRAFEWKAALLPDGTCYRCLNDERWRFSRRAARGNLTGYTSFTNRYSFLLADPSHGEFDVTLVHELFHAQSFFYGLFDRHADNDEDRVRIDERLAAEFTESLGLGR
jgi:hypothetical protein